MQIDFHDFDNLDKVTCNYSVAPQRPGGVRESLPGTLMYIDESKNPSEIRWLDCSASLPKPTADNRVTRTSFQKILDLCYVKQEKRKC